jgi:hypothetical protein
LPHMSISKYLRPNIHQNGPKIPYLPKFILQLLKSITPLI